jgi:hypothetical protein
MKKAKSENCTDVSWRYVTIELGSSQISPPFCITAMQKSMCSRVFKTFGSSGPCWSRKLLRISMQ